MDSTHTTPQHPRRVMVSTYDQGQMLDVVGPLEVFALANKYQEKQDQNPQTYTIEVVAEEKGPVCMSSGLRLYADCSYYDVEHWNGHAIDTFLVGGGGGVEKAMQNSRLMASLSGWQSHAKRFGSVCSGTLLLAKAGLLTGKKATSHWERLPYLKQNFPQIDIVDDAIFVQDGSLYTSAGVTAGIDLALALVEADLGRGMALQVARELVVYLKRTGGQSQFSTQLADQWADIKVLRGLPKWIMDHLNADLKIETLAQEVGMSPRNFARVFQNEFNMTPGKFVEKVRLEQARWSLENHDDSIEQIACNCGFGNTERMSRAFGRTLQVTPRDYRKRFGKLKDSPCTSPL